jgi:hypothetical protein
MPPNSKPGSPNVSAPPMGNPNYALTMASVEGVVFLAIIILAALGKEKRGIEF